MRKSLKSLERLIKKRYENQIGLGLTLAKRVVDFYTGEISLTSTVGEGTTFKISLPKTNITKTKTIIKPVNVSDYDDDDY